MSFPTHIRGRAKADLLDEAATISRAAKAAGREFTAAEADRVEALLEEVDRAEVEIAKSDALLARLAPGTHGHDGSDPEHSPGTKAGGSWGAKTAHQLRQLPMGVKAIFAGGVEVDPAVEIAELPAAPRRISDLIPRVGITENTFSYGRQTVREQNAAVVPDGALKPTSVFTFVEVEDRARVVATLSEPIPLRLLEDHDDLGRILDRQLRAAVLDEIERLVMVGSGGGEEWRGLLTTSGLGAQEYSGSVPETIRRARGRLEDAGVPVNAVAMNSADAISLDLMREDGSSGGFLMDTAAYERIFGAGTVAVTSPHVPAGSAVVGNWSELRFRVRNQLNTLMATQSGELFDRNQAKLRTEQRLGFEVRFPAAFVVADLTA